MQTTGSNLCFICTGGAGDQTVDPVIPADLPHKNSHVLSQIRDIKFPLPSLKLDGYIRIDLTEFSEEWELKCLPAGLISD